jgi:hypothetical protein
LYVSISSPADQPGLYWYSARMTTAGPRHWSMSMRAANLRAKRALLHLGRLPFVMWLVMYFPSTAVPEIIH